MEGVKSRYLFYINLVPFWASSLLWNIVPHSMIRHPPPLLGRICEHHHFLYLFLWCVLWFFNSPIGMLSVFWLLFLILWYILLIICCYYSSAVLWSAWALLFFSISVFLRSLLRSLPLNCVVLLLTVWFLLSCVFKLSLRDPIFWLLKENLTKLKIIHVSSHHWRWASFDEYLEL